MTRNAKRDTAVDHDRPATTTTDDTSDKISRKKPQTCNNSGNKYLMAARNVQIDLMIRIADFMQRNENHASKTLSASTQHERQTRGTSLARVVVGVERVVLDARLLSVDIEQHRPHLSRERHRATTSE
jgi:hypothetical protein